MEKYTLSPLSKIILYGAGELGRECFNKLHKQYQVIAFFDNNAERIKEINGIGVYNPYKTLSFQNDIIIICLHNIIDQEDVAKKLYQCGYHKVIFFPQERNSTIAINNMQNAYRRIIEESNDMQLEVPIVDEIFKEEFSENIIRRTEKNVVLNMDIELLYLGESVSEDTIKKCNNKECSNEYRRAVEKSKSYWGIPAILFRPYITMFDSFLHGMDLLDEYLFIYKHMQNLGHLTDEEFVKMRYQVYQMLEQKFSLGIESFEMSPVEVEWNNKGKFNVKDGMHRVIFLYTKGIKFIPVIMSIQDYEYWVSRKTVQKVKDFIITNKINKFSTHIANPFFSKIPYEREYSVSSLLKDVIEFIWQENLINICFLELDKYDGYFSRHLSRVDCNCTVIENDALRFQLEVLLNELLHTNNVSVKMFSKENMVEEFDVAFVEWDKVVESDKIIYLMNNCIKRFVIVQYDAEKMVSDIIIDNTRFKPYRSFESKYINGRLHKIEVYSVT